MDSKRSEDAMTRSLTGEEVVISGIAGYFPKSNSVMELQENLFKKLDLVSDVTNQCYDHPANPKRLGKINNPNKFDTAYFGIDYIQAHGLLPMTRILLERTYEAIIDAGMNPVELHNTKTGVFVACSFSQSEEILLYEKIGTNHCGVVGCSEAMLAIQIANWLRVTAPAYKLDSACSSSMYALEQAYTCLREGRLDNAIVAGVNVNLLNDTRIFDDFGMLSKDGKCKSFDNSGDGFVRSEAVVVCILQKAKNSKRIYTQIVHSKTISEGFKEEGLMHPSTTEQERLLRDIYKECSVLPQSIQLMECHGTGTAVGDVAELRALDTVICSDRTEPLLIGSIKSNMGHAESVAALCSIAKLCIAYNTGYIAPNIHFWKARENIPALTEGRMQVVTEVHPWNRGLCGMSSFGFGGSLAHTLFNNIAKNKEYDGMPQDDLPRLICVSGRTKAAVGRILDSFESKKVDVEEVRLWQSIHEHNIEGHGFRGYTLIKSSSDKGISLSKAIRRIAGIQQSICYFYSDTQMPWLSVDMELMKLPIFAAAIEKCHEVLESKNIDLKKILSNNDPESNVLNSSIGVIAVQIALTDVLNVIGIKPDIIIGHGVGKIACAYADSCLTTEQAILVAYYWGMAFAATLDDQHSVASNFGYDTKQVDNEKRTKLMEVNSRKAPSSDIIAELLKCLKTVISSPKVYSKHSIPVTEHTDQQFSGIISCTAEYFTQNFTNLIMCAETIREIPTHCIQIDMTTTNKFLERSEGYICKDQKETGRIRLLAESDQNGLTNFFKAVGELFEAGFNPSVANLYPQVSFPVSQGTPMLSHLVEWDHREEWFTEEYVSGKEKCKPMERAVVVSLENNEYLNGHIVNGRVLYPATGYLVLVWETLACSMQKSYEDLSVVFENVCFERSTMIPPTGELEFIITLHRITGEFEITEKQTSIVTGRIYIQNDDSRDYSEAVDDLANDDSTQYLTSEDFYKVLHLKGYGHSAEFQRITKCNVDGTYFEISWNNNWVVFLDGFLQTFLLKVNSRNIMLPTRIEKMFIDAPAHYASLRILSDPKIIKARGNTYLKVIRSVGVEVRGLHVTPMNRRPILSAPVLENHKFLPFEQNKPTQVENALRANIQLLLENVQAYNLKALEIIDEEYKRNGYELLICSILNILDDQSLTDAELTVITDEPMELPPSIKILNDLVVCKNENLVIGANLYEKPNVLKQCGKVIGANGFIMSREKNDFFKNKFLENYQMISYTNTGAEYLVLLSKKKVLEKCVFVELKMDEEYSWIDQIKKQIDEDGTCVVYSQDEYSGILGFIKCLRKEPGGENVRGIFVKDTSAPAFDPRLQFYMKQLQKNLTINVYQNGQWGSYRHNLITDLDQTVAVDNAYLNIETVGDLSSLKWFEGNLNTNIRTKPDMLLVQVYCSALNFRDVVEAIGRVTSEDLYVKRMNGHYIQGIEFVGKTANGSRVMGMTERALSNMVLARSNLVMAIPDEWSFDEAATVFVAYSTAYAALVVYGNLQYGESVLIHAGLGGVGQAAINVALSYGCEIFTTVGSEDKRALIKKLFPQIKDSHIGCSRDTSFEEMIRRETKGQGVNVVLNSLAEEQLLATIRCLGFRGRFVEIGLFDVLKDTPVQMCIHEKEILLHGVVLEYMYHEACSEIRQRILQLMATGITSGTVKPLTYCVFEKNEVLSAYAHFAAGKNVGKVVIKFRDEEVNETKSNSIPFKMDAIRRYTCDSNGVHVLVGGLGGFGLELADWLTLRGARKLLFVSRKGVVNGYQALKLRNFTSSGVEVEISTHDVTTEDGCKEMLKMANSMGHVEAVFNLALVLKDSTLQHQTRETFQAVYEPKASIAFHLDKMTRTLCPSLKHFVVFSSYACGRGNAGQTNYGWANSVMERLCETRKKEGLPALAIQWGLVGDVGYAMDKVVNLRHAVDYQSIFSCISTLEKFMKQNDTVVSSYLPSKKTINTNMQSGVDKVAKMMDISDLNTISHQIPLAELGMDSIVAVEIKHMLEKDYEIFLSVKETRVLTFARLTELFGENRTSNITKADESKLNSVDVPFILRLLLRHIDDESTVDKPSIFMPTITSENDNHGDSNAENVLFMVPGLDGFAGSFTTFCAQLEARACVLQYGLDLNDDILSIVDRMYEMLKVHLNPNKPFNLLGYSYGTVLVVELAARLESEGLKGTVYCIDGSPYWCTTLVANKCSSKDYAAVQNYLIKFVIDATSPGQKLYNAADVEEIEIFENKIEYALNFLSSKFDHLKDHLKQIIIARYNHVIALLNYNINGVKKLKSPIVLIRSKDELVPASNSYDLDMVTDGGVTVHFINSDHLSIVESRQCANIINNYLNRV